MWYGGGFLTEALRLVRRSFDISEKQTKAFAQKAFYGYDLGHANASRARVNMYFAGDGFSAIEGGFNSLSDVSLSLFPKSGFDVILTNPPYGQSAYGRGEEVSHLFYQSYCMCFYISFRNKVLV